MLPNRATTGEDRLAALIDFAADSLQRFRATGDLGPLEAVQAHIMGAHGGPVRQDDLQLEDVIAGLAVLHAAVPGGVVPDHPADPAQVLGPRVGSEAHSALREMGIQLGEENPGLDANEAASGIELEEPLESRCVHHHTGTNRGPRITTSRKPEG